VSADAPRLRVFAGPNGSGKSVLKTVLPPPLLGVYLNPDEIEASIRQNGFLDLAAFGLSTTAAELLPAFTDSSLLQSAGLLEPARRLRLVGGRLDFAGFEVNSRYHHSLELLLQAIKHTSRSFIFDNSTVSANPQLAWIAEIANGRLLELKTDQIPAWFHRAVIEKIV